MIIRKQIKLLSGRISLKALFNDTQESIIETYGGDLIAYSWTDTDAHTLFAKFKKKVVDSIGKYYLPVYRMADGEFHFLLGNVYNINHPKRIRYFAYFIKSKLKELFFGSHIVTSWGEKYDGTEVKKLKLKYINDINELLNRGILCPYLYDNPKNIYVHYNRKFFKYLNNIKPLINEQNIYPFHFPMLALSNQGWKVFIENRKILIISGNLENRKLEIKSTLIALGATQVGFYEISKTKSLKDQVLRDKIKDSSTYEVALVAAGIGALNIISQMTWFKGPVIDIGGFINVFTNYSYIYHGGAVKFPVC